MSFALANPAAIAIKLTHSYFAHWPLVKPCRREADAMYCAVFTVANLGLSPVKFHCQPGRI